MIFFIKFCVFYNEGFPPEKFPNQEIALAIIKAILAHVFLVLIHPFGDGNGRTSRLLEARTLMSAGVPVISSQLLSNFYNKTRTKYIHELSRIWEFEEAHVYYFISYALVGLVDEMRQQINTVNEQVILKVIETDLYNYFKQHKSSTSDRKRELCLFLLKTLEAPLSLEAIFSLPLIKLLYQGKTIRTFRADLSFLEKIGFVKSHKLNKGEELIAFHFSSWVKKMPEAHLPT